MQKDDAPASASEAPRDIGFLEPEGQAPPRGGPMMVFCWLRCHIFFSAHSLSSAFLSFTFGRVIRENSE